MSFFDPQNPGIGGLKELTDNELLTVQNIAGLGSPGADRILFWDQSAGGFAYLTAGSGLSISGTTITATSGGGSVTNAANLTDNAITRGDGGTVGIQDSGILIDDTNVMYPSTSDAGTLGSTTKMWSDLFLASGAVINFNNGNITLTHSTGLLTVGGGNLALGANSLTMTGSIAATGARVTKGWFTDIESTNMLTVGGTSLSSTFAAIGQTMYIGTTAVAINRTTGSLSLTGITSIDGSAAKWTNARTLAGNSVDGSANVSFSNKFIVQGTSDSGLSSAQFLGSLSTGIVKNTTTTGVLSIASAGTDYIAPSGALGTPSSGTLTNCSGLPVSGITASTSTALGVGSIELGHATDTTIARVSAGVVSIEGVNIATVGATQTFTGQNKFNNLIDVSNAITATSNAATVPVTYRLSTVTNNSAATLTITMTTTSAVDGQMTIVRIYDYSAAAQTISWVNTEDSTVTAPTTSNGSTTLPLTVGFMYNSATSKWRCIAKA